MSSNANAEPKVIPTVQGINTTEGVDTHPDLSPSSPVDRAKMDGLFAGRATAADLKNQGILKGDPNDRHAAQKAKLSENMLKDKLSKELGQRPTADELVKKGILNSNEPADP